MFYYYLTLKNCTSSNTESAVSSLFYVHNSIIKRISHIRITGNPITNFAFCVLCLKVYIPAIPPMPPPSKTSTSKVFSGILHLPLLAFHLSSHIAKNVIKFITIK